MTTLTAFSHGPYGDALSTYQISPKAEGFPNFCCTIATYFFLYPLHAMCPAAGVTSDPSRARIVLGFSTFSHFDSSRYASYESGIRRNGNGLPKSSHFFPLASRCRHTVPSGMRGALGRSCERVQTVLTILKLSLESSHSQSPFFSGVQNSLI